MAMSDVAASENDSQYGPVRDAIMPKRPRYHRRIPGVLANIPQGRSPGLVVRFEFVLDPAMMSMPQTISTLAITLAATATLSVAGCKQDPPSTSPDDAVTDQPAESDAEPEDETDDAETDDADEEVASPLNKANFDETINEHFEEVADCYAAALEGGPDLQGKLNAEFTISADGHASQVVAAEGSSLSDAGLVACISAAAAAWSFPVPAQGEMVLPYTFDLAPG